VGCSTNKGAGSTAAGATGGVVHGTGGAMTLTGGSAVTGGSVGTAPATGGAMVTGGASTATGGAATGGTSALTQGSGGVNGTGGTLAATGGVQNHSGGAQYGSGGGTIADATGGVLGTGTYLGAGGTALATGGKAGTGGAGTGGTTSIDPAVGAAINACIDKLPYGGSALSAAKRAPIITAIINTCVQFAPPGAEWQSYCQMFLASAINAESSYDTQAGTQGASGDPSVGLLQIRFSSVVLDFANYGPVDALTRIGCNFGTVTSSDSYATKGSMMLDVNCNVAIGAWYYFIFASGNGGPSVVWVDQYCFGGGVAANLHVGMASFLMGGDAAHSSLSGADYYYNEIKTWFDPCVTYSGTHPFERPIQPDTKKYCR